jgi:hypothetical protein
MYDLSLVTICYKWKALHEVNNVLFCNETALMVEVNELAICADSIVNAGVNFFVFVLKNFRIVHNHLRCREYLCKCAKLASWRALSNNTKTENAGLSQVRVGLSKTFDHFQHLWGCLSCDEIE